MDCNFPSVWYKGQKIQKIISRNSSFAYPWELEVYHTFKVVTFNASKTYRYLIRDLVKEETWRRIPFS